MNNDSQQSDVKQRFIHETLEYIDSQLTNNEAPFDKLGTIKTELKARIAPVEEWQDIPENWFSDAQNLCNDLDQINAVSLAADTPRQLTDDEKQEITKDLITLKDMVESLRTS